jgi:hypothetical protein
MDKYTLVAENLQQMKVLQDVENRKLLKGEQK